MPKQLCDALFHGEEHWTKVLQANEVNSNLIGWHCGGKHQCHHGCSCEKPKRKISRKGSRDGRKSLSKDTNIFTSLYSRFCDWVASTKKDGMGKRGSFRRHSRSGSGPVIRNGGCHEAVSFIPGTPEGVYRGYHTSVSSEDSELSSFYMTSYSSTCSNLTLTSTSTATSDCCRVYDAWTPSSASPSITDVSCGRTRCQCYSSQVQLSEYYHSCHRPDKAESSCGVGDSSGSLPGDEHCSPDCDSDSVIKVLDNDRTAPAGSRRRTFGRTKHPSVSVWSDNTNCDDKDRNFLCATWPPSSRRKLSYDESTTSEKLSDLNESVFSSEEEYADFDVESTNIKELLGDCSIPFSDLKFGECVRKGRRHEIHRGRWHGDVMIHTYNNLAEDAIKEFWSEVSKLSMIRHENIALFMGACLDSPNFAVITSVVKGKSLYNEIHLKSGKLNANIKMAICRQIAQGMGYLHARGIVIRHLNSKNVYLEPKVKLSIMDYGMAEKKHDRTAYGCTPRGNLCYIAPEMMRTLRVLSPGLEPTAPFTKAADVYAFGTILYETMTGQFPFSKMPAEVIIWQIGRGKRQSLKNSKISNTLRRLIEKCWSRNPESRWTFADINKEIQFNTVLHKRHSSSNPEKLNHVGLNDRNHCLFP